MNYIRPELQYMLQEEGNTDKKGNLIGSENWIEDNKVKTVGNFEKKQIITQFTAILGRSPSESEILAIANTPNYGTTIRQMADNENKMKEKLKGMGWTEKEGYMVPPSETPTQFLTDEEHQKLGDLNAQIKALKEKATAQNPMGTSKIGNMIAGLQNMNTALQIQKLEREKDMIVSPGKYIQTDWAPHLEDNATDIPVSQQYDVTGPNEYAYSVPESQQYDVTGSLVDEYPMTGTEDYSDKYNLHLTPSDDPIVKQQQELLKYTTNLKKPYMQWGDEAMNELREKVQSGAFAPDGSAVKDFQFKDLLDDFQLREYGEQRPGVTKYQAGPPPELYSTGTPYVPGQQQGYMPPPSQQYDVTGGLVDEYPMSGVFEGRSYRSPETGAPQFSPERAYQRPEFKDTAQRPTDLQPMRYSGRDVMTQYEQFRPTQTPSMRKIDAQSDVPMYRQEGQRPDIYRAPDAPSADYYDPSGQEAKPVYQAGEFKVEDDPGYQRRYKKALDAIQASAAQRGGVLSPATIKAMQEEAAAIASEETAAAYGRYRDKRDFESGQEREGYYRGERLQDRIADAMRFKNLDQYQRYLDSVGIRRDEQQELIRQWEQDRAFGATQNKERWLRGQAEKELGRALNQDEFNRWMQTEGQRYIQFADQRDWATQQSNLAADKDWREYTYEKGYATDRYDTAMDQYRQDQADAWKKYVYGTSFDAAQSRDQYGRDVDKYQLGTDAYRWLEGMKKSAEQEQYERDRALYGDRADMYKYGTNLDFMSDQNYQNMLQNIYGQDKADFYNLQNQRWQQQLKNLASQRNLQDKRYGQAMDIYNIDAATKAGQYGRLGDIMGTGLTAQDRALGMGGDYADFWQNYNINQSNLQMAKDKQKADKAWNWANLLTGVFS